MTPTPAELPSSFEKKWEELLESARLRDEAWREISRAFSAEEDPIDACEFFIKQARSLGAQEALQRVEGEVIGTTHPQEVGFRSKRKIIKEQRTKLAKLIEEMNA